MKIFEFVPDSKICSYLSDRQSTMRYFYIDECSDSFYLGLLERGWRRFGNHFFVPICNRCTECISIRTLVKDFKFSKNHKRVIKNNQNTLLHIQKPSVSDKHLILYNKYHKYMEQKKSWEYTPITRQSYMEMFVDGAENFGYEFLYFTDSKLVGIGLTDIVKDSVSAVYFFYDHDYSHLSLGTFNILMQLKFAQENNLRYFYPGYWIKDHYCMGYKERFMPFEYLHNAPDIFDKLDWRKYEK
ncbi:arginyltransferase [Helicobacter sp. 10-6591]|uniref:arginyltransferase n=1 Tax=Helicobacter sp. 10-6591 TaxID=2004998 RepID=UPI000DCE8291|nr:arginyltransferase [Helicobacter sp. 10-6591]RAX56317.1 arginyltransferase [Helicobacter sp. 10-6591]